MLIRKCRTDRGVSVAAMSLTHRVSAVTGGVIHVLLLLLVTRSILAARDGADCQSADGRVLLEECCTKMQVSESVK